MKIPYTREKLTEEFTGLGIEKGDTLLAEVERDPEPYMAAVGRVV